MDTFLAGEVTTHLVLAAVDNPLHSPRTQNVRTALSKTIHQ